MHGNTKPRVEGVSVTSSVLGARFGETLPQFQLSLQVSGLTQIPRNSFGNTDFSSSKLLMADVKNYM